MKKRRKIQKIRGAIYLFVFILLSIKILLPLNYNTDIDKFVRKRWIVENGLPINTITSITQTQDSFIWIGYLGGVSKFDGIDFKKLNRLKNNSVEFLFSKHGEYVLIGERRRVKIVSSQGKLLLSENGICINTITMKNNHFFIFSCDKKLFYFRYNPRGKSFHKKELKGINIEKISKYSKNGVIISDKKRKVYLLNKKGFSILSTFTGKGKITALFLDKKERIWVGTTTGLYVMEKKGKKPFKKLFYSKVLSIFEDRNGNIFVATSKGGLRIRDRKVESFLPGVIINCFFEDNKNGLWIGTKGWGLYYFYEGVVKTFSEKDGLSDFISAIKKGKGDEVYAASNFRKKIFIGKRGKFKEILELRGEKFTALEMANNILWIGTEDGLIKYKNQKVTKLRKNEGLIDNFIQSLYFDKKQRLWIGTLKGGITLLTKNGMKKFENNNLLLKNPVYTFYEDENGNMLIGTEKGLAIKVPGKRLNFILRDFPILSILRTQEGTLIAGSYGTGIFLIERDRICNIREENGLISNFISGIFIINNKIWMTSIKGILKADLNEMKAFCRGELPFIKSFVFNKEDGMKSEECSIWSRNSSFFDGHYLWIATKKGIAFLAPEDTKKIELEEFIPAITSLDVNGEKYMFSPNSKYSFKDIKKLKIIFTAPCFYSPFEISFIYRIKELNDDWTIANDKYGRVAEYDNIPEGKYCFKVFSINKFGYQNKKPAVFCFNSKISFLKSSFFKFLLIGIFFFTLFSFIILSFGKKEREKKRYREFSLNEDLVKSYLRKMEKALRQEKLFLDEELTIGELAEHINIPSYLLSYLINEKLNKNFPTLINELRVEEAKRKLVDPEYSDITILEIAFSSGFNTKAAFNRVFKKFTGMTPSRYREKYGKK